MYDSPGAASPPFRADHVGSLLRPQALMSARERYQNAEISAAELRQAEDEAIREAVAFQERIGLHGITDGEYRRGSWHMDFLYRLGGVVKFQDGLQVTFNNQQGPVTFQGASLKVVSKLKLDHTIFGDDFTFLKSVVKNGTPKLTIPAPSMIHYRGGNNNVDESVYPDMNEFWHDVGEVYAQEVEALGKLGLHLPAARRHLPRLSERSQAARIYGEPGRQGRRAAPGLYQGLQRRRGAPALGHGDLHPPVPRQLPLLLGGFGRL